MSKKLISLIFLGLFVSLFAVEAAIQPAATVGAPLDGGLLAILAAAGISYFGARKKKKLKE